MTQIPTISFEQVITYPILDDEAFSQLHHIMQARTSYYVGKFLTTIEPYIQTLLEHDIGEPDVKLSAHTMKSISAQLGALRLSKLALWCEAQSYNVQCDPYFFVDPETTHKFRAILRETFEQTKLRLLPFVA